MKGSLMYHHVKTLMYTVRVDEPDPRFGNMLLEQFGGANGELAAAMQYSIQGINCDDAGRKDLLMESRNRRLPRPHASEAAQVGARRSRSRPVDRYCRRRRS